MGQGLCIKHLAGWRGASHPYLSPSQLPPPPTSSDSQLLSNPHFNLRMPLPPSRQKPATSTPWCFRRTSRAEKALFNSGSESCERGGKNKELGRQYMPVFEAANSAYI